MLGLSLLSSTVPSMLPIMESVVEPSARIRAGTTLVSMITGALLAFTMSLDDFVVSYFVADRIQPLSVYIYSNTAHGAKGVNPALATIIFIPLVAMLLIVNLRRLAKEREYEIQNKKVKMKK